jgi:hypothetical protein
MTTWRIEIGRVRVVGAATTGMAPGNVRAQIEHAVRLALRTASLPKGRASRQTVQVNTTALQGAPAVASAVAHGVTHAVRGPARG